MAAQQQASTHGRSASIRRYRQRRLLFRKAWESRFTLRTSRDLLQNVLANPAAYGFTNATGSAINSSLNGNGYVFWDAEHPTTAADALIGELAAQSVPEPSTLLVFAMSIGGLAVSIKLRGRRRAA